MKKKIGLWMATSAAVMVLLPWLTVRLVPGDAGMAVCFLLFYAVNPVYTLAAGWSAGKQAKTLWSIPVAAAVLFLAGTWLVFDMGERAFLMYAGIYLLLGLAAMLVSALVKRK